MPGRENGRNASDRPAGGTPHEEDISDEDIIKELDDKELDDKELDDKELDDKELDDKELDDKPDAAGDDPESDDEPIDLADDSDVELVGGERLDAEDVPEEPLEATTGRHAFDGGPADLSEGGESLDGSADEQETTGEFDSPEPPEEPTGPRHGAPVPAADEPAAPGAAWSEEDTGRALEAPVTPGAVESPAVAADDEATPPPEAPRGPRSTAGSRRRRPVRPRPEAPADSDFLAEPRPVEQTDGAPRHRPTSGRSWNEAEDAPRTSLQAEEPVAFGAGEVGVGDATRVEPFGHAAVDASEKTLIFGQEAIAGEPDPCYLVILEGEEEGREIDLTGAAYTLGRGPDNDLVLPDIACSRRHAQIVREGEAWFVEDMGSGNGTVLNGQKIKRERLQDGDEVEVGNTVLAFHDPRAPGAGEDGELEEDEEVRTPEPTRVGGHTTILSGGVLPDGGTSPGLVTRLLADPKRKRLVLVGGGALGGLFVLLLLLKLIVPGQPPGPTPEEQERQARIEARRQFDLHMDEAKAAVQAKKWRDALDAVLQAEEYDPGSQMVASYKTSIQIEMAAGAAMSQVRLFMEQREWDKAVAALQGISPESELKEQVVAIKREIDARLLEDMLGQGSQMMAQKQYNQAILKFDEVLRRAPGHEEAMVAKRLAEDLLEKERRPRQVATGGRRRRTQTAPPPQASGLTGQALALYKNGEIDRAIDKAENAGASGGELARLRKFKSAYDKAMGAARNAGQPGMAVEALQAALKIDKEIAGGAGEYHKQLSQRLAKAYFIKGVDAQQGRRLPEAYQSFRAAMRMDSNLPNLKERLADLDKEAKKLYEEAYVIKATNPELAISKLKTAIQIVPPENIYYGKAKKLLGTLTGEGVGSDGDGF
jgi:tetratricopeptide (TPR) repeat protein